MPALWYARGEIELFGKPDNVFDRDPPITPDPTLVPVMARSAVCDRIGRFYAIDVRFRV